MTIHQPTTGGAVHTGSAGTLTVRVLAAGVLLTPAAAVIFLLVHITVWILR
jgi:hypothetical protein